jgi:integrase
MAKAVEGLNPVLVKNAGEGEHPDGGGLFLRVAGASAGWVLRFTSAAGERRRMGLGRCERETLAAAGRSLRLARELATEAKLAIARGLDPLAQRRERRAAERALRAERAAAAAQDRVTLARVAREYHERVIAPSRSEKHGRDWISSLERLVPPSIWKAPVATIEAPALLDAMMDLYLRVPETAARVRQRLDAVFADAAFRGLCASNPAAAIRRKLREGVARAKTVTPHRALDWREVPQFVRALREQPGSAARALEFALLTAARTGEVLGARWAEIDREARLWTVPGSRMKGGEQHAVHLTERALAILAECAEFGSEWVFPSPRELSRPMSNMAMLTLLRRMGAAHRTTAHGLCRASFSTWANETGAGRPDVIEACLAHREGDRIRAAYNRAQFAAERRALLEAWAAYCDGQAAAGNVVALRQVA